jgi:hypothetical protein
MNRIVALTVGGFLLISLAPAMAFSEADTARMDKIHHKIEVICRFSPTLNYCADKASQWIQAGCMFIFEDVREQAVCFKKTYDNLTDREKELLNH